MLRLRLSAALLPLVMLAAACSEGPTAPAPSKPAVTDPDLSLITPLLLPPGADWGLYFSSFNPDRNLLARVIHYPNGTVTGNGSFLIPRPGKSGLLKVLSASPYGNCVPNGSQCCPSVVTTCTNIPESAIVYGIAFFYLGGSSPFTLNLHSTGWPHQTNPFDTDFDTATLSFCAGPGFTSCTVAASFYGELHHEPL